ncbi:MAG: RHS repeat-associated core domain-containing protein [Bacillota bacterium]
MLNSCSYDAFGNAVSSNVTAKNRFMYSGEQYDSITGKYYLRAIFYNPVLGRFMQEDSYRGDIQWTFGRAEGLIEYYNTKNFNKDGFPTQEESLETEIEYMVKEL